MCGIAGIINRDQQRPASEADIRRMSDMMIHRGPDAGGVFVHEYIALGHRRLKIIDLEGGAQPMFSIDQSIVVVFNGEIYNFKSIRERLQAKGYRFRTCSDTEVIVQAYSEYGEACVDQFRGMFAIAIFDRRQNKLLIIRDRLGIKPVYYHLDEDRLLFASEIKPLLSQLPKRPGVHTSVMDFYISVGYVPGEETLFEGIKKLLPGHLLVVQDNRVTIRSYWDLEDSPARNLTFAQARTEFTALLEESVSLRLVSDVPLGAFLSGGLDSSSIVAIMSRLSTEPVKTFSVGYANQPESNELGYAKTIADHFKTEHHEYVLEPLDFFNSLELLLRFTEEPIVESAAVALYQLSVLAKEHVTVILSGEGGDEILAGYPLHTITNKVDHLHQLARWFPQPLRRGLGLAARSREKWMKYWDWINTPLADRYQSISQDVTWSIKERIYRSDLLLDSHARTREYFQSLYARMSEGSKLRKMTYADIKSWLPDDLLVKADKMTMAASLELRVPMLDHRLLEFATALPDRFRLNGAQGKFLLKKTMEGTLPREIIYRKKRGFPVPIASWFRTTLFEKTKEILLDETTLSRGYFRRDYIESVLQRHKDCKEDLSRRIFSLLNLELWHRKYVD